jgi:hypothetical protein
MTTLFDLRKSRIVAEVGGLMALVDTLEIQLANGRATADKLMDAIVAELTVHQSTRTFGCRHRSLSPALM